VGKVGGTKMVLFHPSTTQESKTMEKMVRVELLTSKSDSQTFSAQDPAILPFTTSHWLQFCMMLGGTKMVLFHPSTTQESKTMEKKKCVLSS